MDDWAAIDKALAEQKKNFGLVTVDDLGAHILREKMPPILTFDDRLAELMLKLNTAVRLNGHLWGLAANQLGIPARVMTYLQNNGVFQGVVNPEVVATSTTCETETEGCGSIPGMLADVSRPVWIKVSYQDVNGHYYGTTCEKFAARVFLHELDHLDGILISDHAPLYPRPEDDSST